MIEIDRRGIGLFALAVFVVASKGCSHNKEGFHTREQVLLESFRNSASVVAWSIGKEESQMGLRIQAWPDTEFSQICTAEHSQEYMNELGTSFLGILLYSWEAGRYEILSPRDWQFSKGYSEISKIARMSLTENDEQDPSQEVATAPVRGYVELNEDLPTNPEEWIALEKKGKIYEIRIEADFAVSPMRSIDCEETIDEQGNITHALCHCIPSEGEQFTCKQTDLNFNCCYDLTVPTWHLSLILRPQMCKHYCTAADELLVYKYCIPLIKTDTDEESVDSECTGCCVARPVTAVVA